MNQIPSPYAPPTARVADVEDLPGAPVPFFAVSLLKLAVMSVVTLGLYDIFWFYWNWRLVRLREGTRIMPFLRAFFSIFFCYQLFRKVRSFNVTGGPGGADLMAGPLAIGWIALSLMSALPGNGYLLYLLGFVFLLPVQAAVNRINAQAAPTAPRNAGFTAWNWVGIVLGGLMYVLMVVGMMMPDTPGL